MTKEITMGEMADTRKLFELTFTDHFGIIRWIFDGRVPCKEIFEQTSMDPDLIVKHMKVRNLEIDIEIILVLVKEGSDQDCISLDRCTCSK